MLCRKFWNRRTAGFVESLFQTPLRCLNIQDIIQCALHCFALQRGAGCGTGGSTPSGDHCSIRHRGTCSDFFIVFVIGIKEWRKFVKPKRGVPPWIVETRMSYPVIRARARPKHKHKTAIRDWCSTVGLHITQHPKGTKSSATSSSTGYLSQMVFVERKSAMCRNVNLLHDKCGQKYGIFVLQICPHDRCEEIWNFCSTIQFGCNWHGFVAIYTFLGGDKLSPKYGHHQHRGLSRRS